MQNDALKYYLNTYVACRDAFNARVKNLLLKYPSALPSEITVPSKQDTDLLTNLCYLPATKSPDNLIVISSGVHGLEGFLGNAIQCMFIDELLPEIDIQTTGVLLIHAINPFGFKYGRRVTENNIDLNRNSCTNSSIYKTVNSEYNTHNKFLNPSKSASLGVFNNLLFLLRLVKVLIFSSAAKLRQTILQGQYQNPQGLYYGGQAPEPQIAALQKTIGEYIKKYHKVLAIDLHTGYGNRGKLHLFPSSATNPISQASMKNIFAGYSLDWANTPGYYTVTGDFLNFIGEMHQGIYIPMCFEYGTVNNQAIIGGIHSLHTMILENQGFHYGYSSITTKNKVQKRIQELYYPSDTKWREQIMTQTKDIFQVILKRL